MADDVGLGPIASDPSRSVAWPGDEMSKAHRRLAAQSRWALPGFR
jgi:hypothetical protein